jgi:branched-chain amino acid aminotransferase
VGAYYSEPVKVKIETEFTRAAEGGTGYAKAAGNYAGSLYPAKLAQKQGYHQLVWTDAKEHKYIEESGTMNIMFVINDTLITPEASSTILRGITRDSVLTLARDWGMKVEERKISIKEVIDAAKDGSLQDAFGAGTAATIAHIALIGHDGVDYKLPAIEERKFSNKVLKAMDAIKLGEAEDKFNWLYKL